MNSAPCFGVLMSAPKMCLEIDGIFELDGIVQFYALCIRNRRSYCEIIFDLELREIGLASCRSFLFSVWSLMSDGRKVAKLCTYQTRWERKRSPFGFTI